METSVTALASGANIEGQMSIGDNLRESADKELKAICSVTEVARRVNLSRTRFYQLVKKGVFPPPVRCRGAKRPFYPEDLCQVCIQIRKTGVGHNGEIALFNTVRRTQPKKTLLLDRHCEEYMHMLRTNGLDVPMNRVKEALKSLYPKGLKDSHDRGTVMQELISKLYCDV